MSEQWVVRWSDRWLAQDATAPRSVQTLEEAGKWPTEAAARERLAQTCWGKRAAVERIDVKETQAVKPDVEALLREVDRRQAGGAYDSHPAHEDVREWTNGRIAIELAVALRGAQKQAEGQTRRADANFTSMLAAQEHLRAVLDHAWPDGWGPSVVRKARAFLVGDGQPSRRDDALSLEDIKRCIEAALSFTIPRSTPMQHVPQIVEDAVRKMAEASAGLTRELDAERESHEKTKRERDDALDVIRVLRRRIDGIADVVWKDLPRE